MNEHPANRLAAAEAAFWAEAGKPEPNLIRLVRLADEAGRWADVVLLGALRLRRAADRAMQDTKEDRQCVN